MHRPNLVSTPVFYKIPTTKTITNTIVGATDSAYSDSDIYVHAATATVSSTLTEYNLVVDDATTTLVSNSRYCFGIFTSARHDLNPNQRNILYQLNGAVNVIGDALGVAPYFIFGRSSASTVTADDANPANLVANRVVLPTHKYSWLSSTTRYHSHSHFQGDVLKIYDSTNSNPYFFWSCF